MSHITSLIVSHMNALCHTLCHTFTHYVIHSGIHSRIMSLIMSHIMSRFYSTHFVTYNSKLIDSFFKKSRPLFAFLQINWGNWTKKYFHRFNDDLQGIQILGELRVGKGGGCVPQEFDPFAAQRVALLLNFLFLFAIRRKSRKTIRPHR